MGAIASYVRVSSKSQDLVMQTTAIDRVAAARGDVIERRYAEKFTGRVMDRVELNRLREDAKAGYIKRLYVYRLDRLTRSGIRDTFDLIEELRRHGVELVSISDGFDMNGPAAEIILAVLSWAAKMERIAINERISAARARFEAEGRRWGRPKRKINLEQARALQKQGRTLREIAIAIKVPRATLARALSQNPAA